MNRAKQNSKSATRRADTADGAQVIVLSGFYLQGCFRVGKSEKLANVPERRRAADLVLQKFLRDPEPIHCRCYFWLPYSELKATIRCLAR